MLSAPEPKKRRTKIPEMEREYWRRVFFDELHSRPRVKNLVVQDLRPLWRDRARGFDVPTDWREGFRLLDDLASGHASCQVFQRFAHDSMQLFATRYGVGRVAKPLLGSAPISLVR